MRARAGILTVAVVLITGLVLAGCQPGGGGGKSLQVAVPFSLSGGLGDFEAEAGVPVESRGTGSFEVSDGEVRGGSLKIDPAVITVTPTGPGKEVVALQETSTLIITAWIAPIDEIDTVCGGGEQYGPYNVTLNEDNVPIAVDPPHIDLTDNTVDLLNGGEFSLCIRVESPIDATVRIESLSFDLH